MKSSPAARVITNCRRAMNINKQKQKIIGRLKVKTHGDAFVVADSYRNTANMTRLSPLLATSFILVFLTLSHRRVSVSPSLRVAISITLGEGAGAWRG